MRLRHSFFMSFLVVQDPLLPGCALCRSVPPLPIHVSISQTPAPVAQRRFRTTTEWLKKWPPCNWITPNPWEADWQSSSLTCSQPPVAYWYQPAASGPPKLLFFCDRRSQQTPTLPLSLEASLASFSSLQLRQRQRSNMTTASDRPLALDELVSHVLMDRKWLIGSESEIFVESVIITNIVEWSLVKVQRLFWSPCDEVDLFYGFWRIVSAQTPLTAKWGFVVLGLIHKWFHISWCLVPVPASGHLTWNMRPNVREYSQSSNK